MFEPRPRTKEELEQLRNGTWSHPRMNTNKIRNTGMGMGMAQQETAENSRLNMVAPARIILAALTSYGVGTALGIAQGSKMAGLRFRAEHAHKLPSTPTGWFMYHKSKNYNMARESLKEGARMGVKVCFWTTAMFFIENLYDEYRQSKDFVNTVMASLTVAGGFSLWNRFSLPMTARTTKTALLVGLLYGGLQDAAGAARGRPIGYIEWLRGRAWSSAQGDEMAAP